MTDQFTIPKRFCGPPDSGNGGYVCGLLAGYVEGDAEVTLRMPTPLERPLDVVRDKDGGPERLMAALKDADDRERMKREITRDRLENNWLTNFKQPQNMQYDGKLITDIADMRNQDPADALFDLLIEENLGISTVGLGTNAQTLYAFVSHPAGMIASD